MTHSHVPQLFDLLGFERIDLVSTLLSRRSQVLEARSAGAPRSISPRTFQKLSALVNGSEFRVGVVVRGMGQPSLMSGYRLLLGYRQYTGGGTL